MVTSVQTAEAVYDGQYVDEAPHLLISRADGWEIYGGIVPSAFESQVMSWTSGNHPVGMLIANGPGVGKGELFERSILDVAPTVLHWLDSPIPWDMDGSVIEEITHDRRKLVLTREPIDPPAAERTHTGELGKPLTDWGYLE